MVRRNHSNGKNRVGPEFLNRHFCLFTFRRSNKYTAGPRKRERERARKEKRKERTIAAQQLNQAARDSPFEQHEGEVARKQWRRHLRRFAFCSEIIIIYIPVWLDFHVRILCKRTHYARRWGTYKATIGQCDAFQCACAWITALCIFFFFSLGMCICCVHLFEHTFNTMKHVRCVVVKEFRAKGICNGKRCNERRLWIDRF